jgi:copper(I)-binding protein
MKKSISRRDVLHAGIALCASLALPAARACEFYSTTLRVYHPWTRATDAEDKTAVVCMKFDEVTKTDRLIGVVTPVAAGAEMVAEGVGSRLDLLIPEGRETLLTEQGTHVRLVGLVQPLRIGRSYPLKLVFETGGLVDAQLNVDYEESSSSPHKHA